MEDITLQIVLQINIAVLELTRQVESVMKDQTQVWNTHKLFMNIAMGFMRGPMMMELGYTIVRVMELSIMLPFIVLDGFNFSIIIFNLF